MTKIIDVGDSGRRAMVIVLCDGVLMAATDAEVAFQALDVVVDELEKTKGSFHAEVLDQARELASRLPRTPASLTWFGSGSAVDLLDAPGLEFGMLDELGTGSGDHDSATVAALRDKFLGYSWVRPSSGCYSCGGLLFDSATCTASEIAPREVWHVDPNMAVS